MGEVRHVTFTLDRRLEKKKTGTESKFYLGHQSLPWNAEIGIVFLCLSFYLCGCGMGGVTTHYRVCLE